MSNNKLYDFAGFRLDEEQQCLWRDDEIVSLTPKAYATLRVLVQNKGKVISKNALLDEVWANTFVEEATLAQNISTLRKALAKFGGDKEFIATVPRRGYRFVEDVTEIAVEEQELVVEKHSVTHIVAEQSIHESEGKGDAIARSGEGVSHRDSLLTNRRLVLAASAISILLVAFAAYSYFSRPSSLYSTKFKSLQFGTLLSSGDLLETVVSPDGKYLAVVEKRGTADAIFLRQIESGNMIEVLPKSNLLVNGVAFSPKSDHIYYSAYEGGKTVGPRIGKLYKIPILGGAPQEIISDIDSPVAISSDSTRIAFVRNDLKGKKTSIITANIDGKGERTLATSELNGYSTSGVSFSPNGKMIAASAVDIENKAPARLVTVDTETGEQTFVGEMSWLWIGRSTWLKDSSGIALVAYGTESPNITDEIWFVSYPEGKGRLIANGLRGVNGISVTDDLSSIVATRSNRINTAFIAPVDNIDRSEEIAKTAKEEALLTLGAKWDNEGKIVFAKTQNGNADIWVMDADGSNQRQITSDKSADFRPILTAEGKYIYFLSNRGGSTNIWRVDRNGENPKQITKNGNVGSPSVSLEGDAVYYIARSTSKPRGALWRVGAEGENPKQITTARTYGARVSPDGKYVFCYYPEKDKDPEDFQFPLRYTVLSVETGEIVSQYASLRNRRLPLVEWAPDSKSFLYVDTIGKKQTLYRQKIDGGESVKLKEWNGQSVFQLAISQDGERLYYEVGEQVNSVIQIRNVDE